MTEKTATEIALSQGMSIREALENEYRRGYFAGLWAKSYHPAPDDITLEVDPLRAGHVSDTGIYVRAKLADRFGAFDIAELTRDSLHAWLRSRGGENIWAEEVVFALLNYPTTKPIRGYARGSTPD